MTLYCVQAKYKLKFIISCCSYLGFYCSQQLNPLLYGLFIYLFAKYKGKIEHSEVITLTATDM